MGNIVPIEQINSAKDVISLARDKFTEIAEKSNCPLNMEAEETFALQHLQANSYLMRVALENKGSLASAMVNIAGIGLSLNPALKQAYLVPRNVGGVSKVCFDPSYQGLCDLATGTGRIEWIQANIVYSGDEFKFIGVDKEPEHTYNPFLKNEDRGTFIGAYSVAKTNKGDYLTEIMSSEDIYKIRDASEMYKKFQKGPWKDFFEEMAKKSVVRRQFKMLPKAVSQMQAISEAIHVSNENEGMPPIVNNPELSSYTSQEKERYDLNITNNNHLDMYVMSRTTEEGIWISLYHSFGKGEKGKYQGVVNSLVQKGCAEMNDCIEAINSTDEPHAVLEIIEDMIPEALTFLSDAVTDESRALIEECTKGDA